MAKIQQKTHADAAAAGRPGDPAARRSGPRPEPGLDQGRHDIRDLEMIAHWLDSRFSLFGVRFGLDTLVGLIPGVGDAATTVPAAYILFRAWRMGVPRPMLARMGLNVGMDLALGSIPLVGDIFDLSFKANRRNVEMLRQHLGEARRTELRDPVQGSI